MKKPIRRKPRHPWKAKDLGLPYKIEASFLIDHDAPRVHRCPSPDAACELNGKREW